MLHRHLMPAVPRIGGQQQSVDLLLKRVENNGNLADTDGLGVFARGDQRFRQHTDALVVAAGVVGALETTQE